MTPSSRSNQSNMPSSPFFLLFFFLKYFRVIGYFQHFNFGNGFSKLNLTDMAYLKEDIKKLFEIDDYVQ